MRKFLLLIILTFLVGYSCKNNSVESLPSTEIPIDLQDSNLSFQNKVYVKYKIPLPLDLFDFLSKKGSFNSHLLTPKKLKTQLLTEKHKALALGIFNADLAYCTVLGQGQTALDYFNVSKEIAQELNIEAGYSDRIFERLNNNLDNVDSIKKITDEAYWKACNYLEDNNKNNILPFVVVGGWYESLYLILNSQNESISNKDIKKIILKQRKSFENIKQFLYDVQLESTAYYFYKDLKKIIKNIQSILELYNKYDVEVQNRDKIYNEITNKIIAERKKLLTGKL